MAEDIDKVSAAVDTIMAVGVDVHVLRLTMDDGGVCGCGEAFTGSYTDVVKAWHAHAVTVEILEETQASAMAEYSARVAVEHGIRKLSELGMSSREISSELGTDGTGKALYSPTIIQHMARGEYAQTPRRRYQRRA
jgi:hypothetical protein